MSRYIGNQHASQDQESGEKQEFREVTAELLAETLTSEEFLSVLHQAIQAGIETKHETGFSIGLTNGLVVGEMFGAGEEGRLQIKSKHGQSSLGPKFWENGMWLIFDAHFHQGSSIEPTLEDLRALFSNREYMKKFAHQDTYPIMAIVAYPGGVSSREIFILVLQEKQGQQSTSASRGDAVHNLFQNLRSEEFGSNREEIDPQAALKLLKKIPSLQATLISYRETGKGASKKLVPTLSQDSIVALLKKFAFQSRRVSQA